MPIDLTYSADVLDLIERTRAFVRDTVLPIEDEHGGDITAAGGDAMRVNLQKLARDAGVFAPHAPVGFGGLGLNMSERAPVVEQAGASLFGPTAPHVAAPDERNAHMPARCPSPRPPARS